MWDALQQMSGVLVSKPLNVKLLSVLLHPENSPLRLEPLVVLLCALAYRRVYLHTKLSAARMWVLASAAIVTSISLFTWAEYGGFLLAQNPVPEVKVDHPSAIASAKDRQVFLLGQNGSVWAFYVIIRDKGGSEHVGRYMYYVNKEELPGQLLVSGSANIFEVLEGSVISR